MNRVSTKPGAVHLCKIVGLVEFVGRLSESRRVALSSPECFDATFLKRIDGVLRGLRLD